MKVEFNPDDNIIREALQILERRAATPGELMSSPRTARDFFRLRLGQLPYEQFEVMYLDATSRMIAAEAMFRGTLTQTSVYPREVVKGALEHNAAAVVFAHNHPSGSTAPSRADDALTQTLKAALALVDVRVLDHLIITAHDTLSMAEKGLL
jgi:DNA repair protein RadC